jgi:prepilin-type N-terminal cleavage/methylation domain-containing protein
MLSIRTNARRWQTKSGFSLLEMMFATVILLVGLVAVAQLVPSSILLNTRNRKDSSSLVFAQRELDQMLDQPLVSNSFTDPQGVFCPPGNICGLGDPTKPNQVVGSPVVVVNNFAVINFGAALVDGYNFTYPDPLDPNALIYDVRWAVITSMNGPIVSSKRLIVGVRQVGNNGTFQPVTLDTVLEK